MSQTVAEAARPSVDLAGLRTLAMFEAQAEAGLPVDAFAYASGGSSSEATLERNRHALRHLAIEQRVLMNVKTVDTRAYFAGMTLPSPIIVSPMGGMPRFHADGDLEMARGATRDGGMTVVAVKQHVVHAVIAAAYYKNGMDVIHVAQDALADVFATWP